MENEASQSRSICVAARFAALPELLVLLSQAQGLSENKAIQSAILRAKLAVEELFANSIRHGYGSESDNPVWLSVEMHASFLRIIYKDAARAFNPFEGLDDLQERSGMDVTARDIGGLGRMLIRQMARHHTYQRDDGRNIITLEYDWASAS